MGNNSSLISQNDLLDKHLNTKDVAKTERNVLHERFSVQSLISELTDVTLSDHGLTYGTDIVALRNSSSCEVKKLISCSVS